MKKLVLSTILFAILVGGYIYYLRVSGQGCTSCGEEVTQTLKETLRDSSVGFATSTIEIGNKIYTVEIARTDTERTKGLSGRNSLATDTGLVFIFDKPDKYGFWMKDMNFPIDIIWFDENWKIVHIEDNLSPQSFPKIFYPKGLSLYVFEINAGEVERAHMKIGDMAVVQNLD